MQGVQKKKRKGDDTRVHKDVSGDSNKKGNFWGWKKKTIVARAKRGGPHGRSRNSTWSC